MKKARAFVHAVISAVFLLPAQSASQGLILSQSIGASHNPLGLIADTRFLYRLPLIKSSGVLWEGTKVEAGVCNEWTPADNLAGARITVMPLSLTEISMKAGYYRMYNGLGFGCWTFEENRPDYSPAARRVRDPVDASGFWATVSPSLRLKLGRVVAVNTMTFNHIALDVPESYLEIRSHTIHRNRDFNLVNAVYLLYEAGDRLLAGGSHQITAVRGTGVRTQRVCAMLIFRPALRWIEKPFLAFTGGVYTEDPLYAGYPYAGLMTGGEWGIGRLGGK